MTSDLDYLMRHSEEFRNIAGAQEMLAKLPDADRELVRRLVRMALRDGFLSGLADGCKAPADRRFPGQFADEKLWQYVDRLPLP